MSILFLLDLNLVIFHTYLHFNKLTTYEFAQKYK